MSFDEVVAALGGMQAVASLLGVTLQAVCNMKARGFFPSRHWAALVREADTKGKPEITFEALAAISDAAPKSNPPAQSERSAA